jgi:hypothetical protein
LSSYLLEKFIYLIGKYIKQLNPGEKEKWDEINLFNILNKYGLTDLMIINFIDKVKFNDLPDDGIKLFLTEKHFTSIILRLQNYLNIESNLNGIITKILKELIDSYKDKEKDNIKQRMDAFCKDFFLDKYHIDIAKDKIGAILNNRDLSSNPETLTQQLDQELKTHLHNNEQITKNLLENIKKYSNNNKLDERKRKFILDLLLSDSDIIIVLKDILTKEDKIITLKQFFTSCPSAVILQNGEGENKTNIWCCHGGFPYNGYGVHNGLTTFVKNEKKSLKLSIENAAQVRWNDLNVNETKLGPRSEGQGPDWAIDQDTLKAKLKDLGIDFLIRGHQDSYANTVLFVKKNNTSMIDQFKNGLDIQDIMRPKADKPKADKPKADKPKADEPKSDEPKADKPIASKLESEIKEFENKVNPIGSIQYKTDNTQLSYQFGEPKEPNPIEPKPIEPKTNDYQEKIKNLKAITISTNTDYGRPLTRDSFVVIKFK